MNKSIMMGRLVRDPEIRYQQGENGQFATATFRIAVERKFVRKDGVKADFFSCSAVGRMAEFAENYLLQGIKVLVTGRMENDNYTNRDGEKVYGMRLIVDDIEFAESKKAAEGYTGQEAPQQTGRSYGNASGNTYREQNQAAARDAGAGRSNRNTASRSTRSQTSANRSAAASSSRQSRARSRSIDEQFDNMPEEEMAFN